MKDLTHSPSSPTVATKLPITGPWSQTPPCAGGDFPSSPVVAGGEETVVLAAGEVLFLASIGGGTGDGELLGGGASFVLFLAGVALVLFSTFPVICALN